MKQHFIVALCASGFLASSAALAQMPPPPPAGAPAQAPAAAQPPAPQPLAMSIKAQNDAIKRNVAASATKMPEEHYAFKPTPDVRSFGELIGHLANANYGACSRAKGEANPNQGKDWEKTTAKADLVKALSDAIAYCDTAYSAATDASLVEMIKVPAANNMQREVARGNNLVSNIAHNNEHYGNLVTYMRIKGLVPPSSEPRPTKD